MVDLSAPAAVSRYRKAEILLGRDLALMATASRYDLGRRGEDQRSVRDLDRLFAELAHLLEIDVSVRVTDRSARLDLDPAVRDIRRPALRIGATGAPKAVLTGARRLLDRAAVVLVAVEDRRYWSGDRWPRPQVLSYLYDRGLVPVARDFQSRYAYNVLLVRAELLGGAEQVRRLLRRFNSVAYQGRAEEP
jgi:hypothetical protein